MNAASSSFGDRLQRIQDAVKTLHRVGVLDPRFVVGAVRAGRRHGPSAAIGVGAAAMTRPNELAVIDDRGELTFRQLYDRCLSIAHGLRDLGVTSGSQIGILCRNHAGFLEATYAAALLGADVCYLNTGFAGPQLKDVAAREKLTAILFDQEFEEIMTTVPPECTRVWVWHDTEVGGPTLDTLAANYAPEPVPRPERVGRGTILTSGTTGTPKGAQRGSNMSDAESGIGLLELLPVRVGARMLISAPMFHAWGLAQMGLGGVFGNTLVLQRRFDPLQAVEALEKYRVNLLVVVPVMLQRILALDGLERFDTSALEGTLSSGSALPGELALRWMDIFGDNLYNFYGSTEVAQASIATPKDLRAAPGTAGRIPRGAVVKILDDKGREVPVGESGRIFVGNANQFEGYTGGGNKEMVDGLMSIGDLGWFDTEGRLFVGGRDDDMIVSGGENVFPREVEDLLSDHPDVHEAAVIGVPDDDFGQRLRGFVVPNAGRTFDEEQLKQYVRDHLARHKVPRELVEMDELPRNPTGKILKRVLREWTPASNAS